MTGWKLLLKSYNESNQQLSNLSRTNWKPWVVKHLQFQEKGILQERLDKGGKSLLKWSCIVLNRLPLDHVASGIAFKKATKKCLFHCFRQTAMTGMFW